MNIRTLMRTLAVVQFFFACAAFSPIRAQFVTAPDVRSLSQEVKDTVTALKLTGQLELKGNSDFRQMRDVCGKLAVVDMRDANVEVIPENAFFAAKQLKQVILPATLKHVERYAFFRCTSLNGTLALPEGLESVDEGAFQGCSGVSSLSIPGSLHHIAPWAFSRFINLRDVLVLPEGVQTIGRGAFYLNFRMTGLDLPASLDSIAPEAFGMCFKLEKIRVRATEPPVLSPSAFRDDVYECAKLEVPEGCEKAYRNAPGWSRFFGKDEPAAVAVTDLNLIPMPVKVEALPGKALVWKDLPLLSGAGMYSSEYEQLNEILEEYTDYERSKGARSYMPCLSVDEKLGPQAYVLQIDKDGLKIVGGSTDGIFYGIMTLRQVLISGAGEGNICKATAPVRIEDEPRLDVRQLMIDPARTFLKIKDIEGIIREMAYLKYNMLQIHFCDDQAWRVEIKAYPELTAMSSVRLGMNDMHRRDPGFYSQYELKNLVEYAKKWHVMLVPELEMPGHQTAAFHALPWLTCDSTKRLPMRVIAGVANELLCPARESTYKFLGTVINELCSIFPDPYFHLGGDEAGHPSLGAWTHCADCQALAKRLGVKTDGSENWRLQEYMFARIIDTLQTKYGKIPMFWYETDFHNIPKGCVTYAWRHGKTNQTIDAVIRNKARILLCPGEYCYFDYPIARGSMPEQHAMHPTSLEQVYNLDPTWGRGSEFEQNNLFGVAGTLWGEWTPESERVFYMAFPRSHALAEVAWSPQSLRSYPDFLRRLIGLSNDLSRRAVPWSNKF